jgi:HSP90 family molecular chaperone
MNRLGSYEIAEAEGVAVGTKIVIYLKKGAESYATTEKIEGFLPRQFILLHDYADYLHHSSRDYQEV